jgi:hypothetical protein
MKHVFEMSDIFVQVQQVRCVPLPSPLPWRWLSF